MFTVFSTSQLCGTSLAQCILFRYFKALMIFRCPVIANIYKSTFSPATQKDFFIAVAPFEWNTFHLMYLDPFSMSQAIQTPLLSRSPSSPTACMGFGSQCISLHGSALLQQEHYSCQPCSQSLMSSTNSHPWGCASPFLPNHCHLPLGQLPHYSCILLTFSIL